MPWRSHTTQYSKSSEDFQPGAEKSSEPASDDSEFDLTLDDLRCTEDEVDADVIEALTEGDLSAIESECSEPVSAPAPEPTAAPNPTNTTPNNSGMSFESYKRLAAFAEGDELVRTGHTFYCGGEPDLHADIDALLAGLDEGMPAPEPEPKPDPERDLSKLVALLRNARIAAKAKSESRSAETAARIEAAKLDRKRDLTRERVKRHRAAKRVTVAVATEQILKDLEATPGPYPTPWRSHRPYQKRLRALCEATASPKADAFLIQIRGREIDMTDAWAIALRARHQLGPDASLRKIANTHPDQSMTKDRIRNLLRNVSELERMGRPWHDLSVTG